MKPKKILKISKINCNKSKTLIKKLIYVNYVLTRCYKY